MCIKKYLLLVLSVESFSSMFLTRLKIQDQIHDLARFVFNSLHATYSLNFLEVHEYLLHLKFTIVIEKFG